jgi:hypothetical protein
MPVSSLATGKRMQGGTCPTERFVSTIGKCTSIGYWRVARSKTFGSRRLGTARTPQNNRSHGVNSATSTVPPFASTIRRLMPGSSGYQAKLIGRLIGDEIVQEGSGSDGALLRWLFGDIRPNAFRWHAEISRDDGATWFKALEMFARRT